MEKEKIETLRALYALEPTIYDVYVEGPFDRRFLTQFFEKHGKRSTYVKEVSRVDVPAGEVLALGENVGNRGRVVALAKHLESYVRGNNVTCIADSDFDFILGRRIFDGPLLFYTDHTSLDLCLFDADLLNRFLAHTFSEPKISAVNLLEYLTPVLRFFFLARLTNQQMALKLTWPDFTRVCKLVGNRIEVDEHAFLLNYLATQNRRSDITRFESHLSDLRKKSTGLPRCEISGHDFTALLSWYLSELMTDRERKEFGGMLKTNREGRAEALLRILSCCADMTRLVTEPLFLSLVNRTR